MADPGRVRSLASLDAVRDYWDSHLNLTQFLDVDEVDVGSDEFFRRLRETLTRYDYKERVLRDFSPDAPGEKLLEVGCGLGVELAELGRLGFDVTGIDLAPSAVQVCNEYLEREGIRGRARAMNAERLEFPDDSFDAAYSSGVLQHTPEIDRAISELWRVLKPGGRILIILYHRRSWFYLLHRLSGASVEFDSDDAPIVNSYTRNELETLFSRFRDLQIECEYYRPLPTRRRGVLPFVYNRVFVPAARAMPDAVIRRFGWHLVLTGRK
jgi:ubiquinone/menaquinone biosynthesis C-methylase UbiE